MTTKVLETEDVLIEGESIKNTLTKLPDNWIKSVNGIEPDANGNIQIPISNSALFIVNGVPCYTLIDALNLVNNSNEIDNYIVLTRSINLDKTEVIDDLPTIQKNLVIDLGGNTIYTNKVFSKSGSYGWGDRLFRIQNLDGSQSAINFTLRNGSINSVTPVGAGRSGILYTTSSGTTTIENITINWDMSNISGGYANRTTLFAIGGSNGATFSNVNIDMIAGDNQGCVEVQTLNGGSHPEYVFDFNECNFKLTNKNGSESPWTRSSRNSIITAGYGVTVNINGCTLITESTYSVINTFSSGALININEGTTIESRSIDSKLAGPCIRLETVVGSTPIVNINGGNFIMPNTKNEYMLCTSPQDSSVTISDAGVFNINGGDFNDFTFAPSYVNIAVVSGGTFNKDINSLVDSNGYFKIAEGYTCVYDDSLGKWIVK